MSAITVFFALCIASVPFFVYVFVSFWRDGKRTCRCTCQIAKVSQRFISLELPGECLAIHAEEDISDDGDVSVLVHH